MTKKQETCNYMVASFSETGERECGRRAIGVVRFKEPFTHYGTMWYCRMHLDMAEDYLPDGHQPEFLTTEAT